MNRDLIGSPIEDLDTPALLLDGPASDRNLRRMAEFFAGRKCRLRPHFKNHKCASLARRQQAAGYTVGFTCAKLGEAEVLAEGGIENVLIANQVVGPRKVARLVELAGKIEVTVAVDDVAQGDAISQAAAAAGVTVGALVEVDIGMGRCGVAPGEPALELAQRLLDRPGLEFRGIQAYEGHVVYMSDSEERAARVRESMALAVDTRRLIESRGIPVGVISGGATSTYRVTGLIDGVDEIQAGTYPTMDWRYHELAPEFEIAMTILARVISKRPGAAILDVGCKGVGDEFGPPRIRDAAEVEIPFPLSEEHATVHHAPDWRMGHTVHLIPSHACTTTNLYREIYVHEEGRVREVWRIEGSGRLA
ncbi:MAG: DSD1 family PLP-dependent enzyme [Planctomycetes bacterium]|nr:DSD1 family PLP-dependent enzyme [Planctomycetota bacterium]